MLVKICGVRTLAGAQAAVDAGADLLGFICHPPARRYVPPEQIAAILAGLRGRLTVRAVGVFVNQPVDEMHMVADGCGLDLIQLSGDEGDEAMSLLEWPVIKAWRGHLPLKQQANSTKPAEAGWSRRGTGRDTAPAGLSRLRTVSPTLQRRAGLFAALLEPQAAGWGGAGQVWDWSVARSVTDLPSRPPVFLAGGLQPENVAGAIAAVRPDGVDVSSGVETNGVQDSARIAAFVAAAKGATIR
jgi:phosphoribosylanthranilate isomerase